MSMIVTIQGRGVPAASDALCLDDRAELVHQLDLLVDFRRTAIGSRRALEGAFLASTLAERLESYSVEYLLPAVQGDIDAAGSLMIAAGDKWRGLIVAMFYCKYPQTPLFRRVLEMGWLHDHREVIGAARTRDRLRAMFRAAQFPVDIGGSVTVQAWRGVVGQGRRAAARGYSWTVDRDTACWFAMRRGGIDRAPCVVTATIPREAIVFQSNERSEAEIVAFDINEARIDGDPTDWARGFERLELARSAAT